MLQAYKEFWLGYLDFKGKTSIRGYWLAFLANYLVISALSMVAKLVTKNFLESYVLLSALSLIFLLPGLAITVRRLRDAGFPWTNLFWVLLPLIGWIVLIAMLRQPSGDGSGSISAVRDSGAQQPGTAAGNSTVPALKKQMTEGNAFYVFIAKGQGLAKNMIVFSHDDSLPDLLKQRYPAARSYQNVVVNPKEWKYPPYGLVAPDGSNVDWNALWNAAYRHLVNHHGVRPEAAKAALERTANNSICTFVPTTGKVTFGVPVEG